MNIRICLLVYVAQIYTVGTGVAVGQACVLLSAGDKGKRFMTPHATAMLHQPRVPSTGERQATELNIKWHETLAQKKTLLNVLSKTTGHSVEKLDKVSLLTVDFQVSGINSFFLGYAAATLYDSCRRDPVWCSG